MRAYQHRQIALVEDLINTYDTFLSQPEHLRTPADLDVFLRERDFPSPGASTPSDLEQVRVLRAALRQVWNGETIEEIATPLNRLLKATGVALQIQPLKNGTWHLGHIIPNDTPLVERLKVETALGILTALEQHGIERLRSCDSAPCHDVFIDLTRNRSRRFCDDRCANRYHTAAFRERQHDDES